jgi:hypothetical protein
MCEFDYFGHFGGPLTANTVCGQRVKYEVLKACIIEDKVDFIEDSISGTVMFNIVSLSSAVS